MVGTAHLPLQSMDSALRSAFGAIPSVDCIKLDVHGIELDILAGAAETIANGVVACEIEVSFQPIWKDQALFYEVSRAMMDLGFELFDLRPYYWRRSSEITGQVRGQMAFGDALYLRPPESVLEYISSLADAARARAKAVHAMNAYLVFGYKDLAASLLRRCGDLFSADERAAIDPVCGAAGPLHRLGSRLLRRGRIFRMFARLARATDTGGRYFSTMQLALGNYFDGE